MVTVVERVVVLSVLLKVLTSKSNAMDIPKKEAPTLTARVTLFPWITVSGLEQVFIDLISLAVVLPGDAMDPWKQLRRRSI